MISAKIKKLRNKFNIRKIDGYVVPKNDSYFNEYSSPDRLKFISNFDGSAGLAIILKKKNYLFVDGRYTIQAKSQCGNYFHIVEIHKKLPWEVLKRGIKIGYNPYCFTSLSLARYFKNYFKLVPIYDDLIIKKKSRKVDNKFYFIEDHISGESAKSKINKVLKYLREDKSDCLFITAPENVAWLLNLRGRDNPHSPIPNCRLILKNNSEIYLFVNKSKIQSLPLRKKLLKINIIDEDKINTFLNNFTSKKIILDRLSCSIAYTNLLKNRISISNKNDPIYNMKSIKNDIEIKNSIIGICMENDIVNYYSDIKDKNDEIGNSFIHELKILGHKYSATYIFLTTAIHKSNILNKLFRKIGLINENLQYDPLPDQSAVNDSIRALKELRLLIKNDPLIIIIPSRDLWNKEKSKKAFAIHVSFLALLESNGFNYLDLREPLERNNDPLKYFFKNDPHWNSSGHELVAEEIFLYLQS